MKLTPSSLGQKRTQTSPVSTTETLFTLTGSEYEKLKRVMRDLYDSDQSEHGDILFKILKNMNRISMPCLSSEKLEKNNP